MNFIPSGFVLLAVNGLTQILAALMLFKKHPWAYALLKQFKRLKLLQKLEC